ncbi:MAG: dihydroneopterin aldolase, partial [Oscillospiraceae bacterium]|nr:dihydroneopterin aldolase [Oscillospiraceae bacterium]
MDKISIKNLEIFANHGLFPEENALGQKFVISAELFANLRGAGETDDLSLSLDYGGICGTIKSFVEGNTFKLIETVAERLAEKLLVGNPRLQSVRLEVKKPWAPVAMHLDTVSVEITRSRHTAYIAIGSNIGDREANLKFAVDALDKSRGCRVLKVSNF